MKCEIINIVTQKPPFSGTSKTTGKPYTIYNAECVATLDGKDVGSIAVKSYNPITHGEYEAKMEEYKGNVSYMISKPKTGFSGGFKGGYQKEQKITMQEFSAFASSVAAISKTISPDKWVEIFPAMLGNANVMVERSGANSTAAIAGKITNARPSDVMTPDAALKDELEF